MNIHLALLHSEAMRRKNHWKNEREKLGKLFAPRTDWMVFKFTRLEESLRMRLNIDIESKISDDQLYHDLSLTKENH